VEQRAALRKRALRSGTRTQCVPCAQVLKWCLFHGQRRHHDQAAQAGGRIIRNIRPEDLPAWPGYTIGSSIVFPGNKVDGKMTINGARGFNSLTADRFDLTLECIRRYYLGRQQPNPLEDALLRYEKFFALVGDFNGYVEFFLLQDLLKDDGKIDFFHEFKDFSTPAVPQDETEYLQYRAKSNSFISARNARNDAQPCMAPC
jgi:hypothetical protein